MYKDLQIQMESRRLQYECNAANGMHLQLTTSFNSVIERQ